MAPTAPPARICGNSGVLDGPTTAPPGAVVIHPGQNVNDATQGNHAGTTFYLVSGTHTLGTSEYGQVIPKTGNSYIGAPGAVLDGKEVNRYAFTQTATAVTIKHLTIRNFVALSNEGTVNSSASAGWTITNNTIENNGGSGVFTGDNVVIRDNCIRRNGAHGIGGYRPAPAPGYGPSAINNITVDRNEISHHPRDNIEETNPGCGCTGGAKFWDTRVATITNNWVHHNSSPALWVDANNVDFLIEGNYFSDNGSEAVWYEISYNGTIRNNAFLRNGWTKGASRARQSFPDGAIYVSEAGGDARVSPNRTTLEISGNYLEDNWGGVVLWEGPSRFCGSTPSFAYCTKVNPDATPDSCGKMAAIRNEPLYSDCRWRTQNVLVTGNELRLNKANLPPSCTGSPACGQMGLFSVWGTDYPPGTPYKGWVISERITFNSNNRFQSNSYVGDWRFTAYHTDRKLTWDEWRAAPYNQDVGSTLNGDPLSRAAGGDTTTAATTTTKAPPRFPAGYWTVAADGGIFAFGGTPFAGSTGAIRLNRPIVGMAATPTGRGYWLVAADGGIFAFGDAEFHGSTGAIRLNRPIVGMAATTTGKGYWMVASDGGIFAFGDASFKGSTGAIKLNHPMVGMAATTTGKGYWMVASDGGIFAFGDGVFHGSTGAIRLNQPMVGMASQS